MSVTLTIITATYNRANVIKNCLDSVLNQKFKNIEHLIIDNMSSDNTQKIVEDYIEKADYKVRYIREPDTGIYNAFNKGIRMAEGEWIHFLNSDDVYYDTELLNSIFSENVDSYDLLACTIIRVFKKSNFVWIPEYIIKSNEYNFSHPGTIIKKEFLINNGYYNESLKITSDTVFNWQHYDKSNYKLINSLLVTMSTEGLSNQLTVSYFIEKSKILWYYSKFSFLWKIRRTLEDIIYFIIYRFLKK